MYTYNICMYIYIYVYIYAKCYSDPVVREAAKLDSTRKSLMIFDHVNFRCFILAQRHTA